MKEHNDYIKDIAEIRLMMERSSKFLSLSGWAGILAGIYALSGAWFAYSVLEFHPDTFLYTHSNSGSVALVASVVLILALISAFIDSRIKAKKRNEKVWNITSKRMLASMALPLVTGGLLILILSTFNMLGLVSPLMLIFYGLALYNAGFYTIPEVRAMGFIQIVLGLLNAFFISNGLLFWAIGFGIVHIVYGIYMHFSQER
ncbi:MAG TPA: hypothetical protein VKM36_12100 [Balneolaceae bacterium]|nr:hypothetical protein [Balneolaceae bacterium]